MDNNFRKKFAWFGGLGPWSMPFLINQSTAINLKSTDDFLLFEVVHWGNQNSKYHQQKLIGPIIFPFFLNHKWACKYSLHNRGK